MKAQIFTKKWEEENGLLLIELQQRLKSGLWEMIKFKKATLNLALFLIYLSLQGPLKFLALAVGFIGRHELKFQVGPENPSVAAGEFNHKLHERTGPNVFLR